MLSRTKEFVDNENPDFSSIASWLHSNGIKKEQFASYCNALGEYGSDLKKILDYFPPYRR